MIATLLDLLGAGIDRDGLALGIIETIHGLDVHHPAHAQEDNHQQNDNDEQAHQNAGRYEAHTIPGIAECEIRRSFITEWRLQLKRGPRQRINLIFLIDGRIPGGISAGIREAWRRGHSRRTECIGAIGCIAHCIVALLSAIGNVKGDSIGSISCQGNGELNAGGVGDFHVENLQGCRGASGLVIVFNIHEANGKLIATEEPIGNSLRRRPTANATLDNGRCGGCSEIQIGNLAVQLLADGSNGSICLQVEFTIIITQLNGQLPLTEAHHVTGA